MTEQTNQFANRERYEQEIAARELLLEEIAADIDELEEQLEDARGAAIVGDGKPARIDEIKAKIEQGTKRGIDAKAEIEAVKKRLSRFDQAQTVAQQQQLIEERVAPNALALADAAHRAELAAEELGKALGAMCLASRDAVNAWPIVSTERQFRGFDVSHLYCHIWAKVCAAAGGAIPYVSPQVVPGDPGIVLHRTGRDAPGVAVPADKPMLARIFAWNWLSALRDEAGRPDLAEQLQEKIERSSPSPTKRAKAAA